jgi:hypothetical protein
MKALTLSMVPRSMEHPLTSSDRATSPRSGLWRAIAAVEVAVAAMVVLFDLSIPTLVLLAMAVVSLVVRGRGPGTLGLRRPVRPVRMAAEVLGLSVLWSVLVLALFIPVMEHLTGQQQDVSQFLTSSPDRSTASGRPFLADINQGDGDEIRKAV